MRFTILAALLVMLACAVAGRDRHGNGADHDTGDADRHPACAMRGEQQQPPLPPQVLARIYAVAVADDDVDVSAARSCEPIDPAATADPSPALP
jgi:hypothetical protein